MRAVAKANRPSALFAPPSLDLVVPLQNGAGHRCSVSGGGGGQEVVLGGGNDVARPFPGLKGVFVSQLCRGHDVRYREDVAREMGAS